MTGRTVLTLILGTEGTVALVVFILTIRQLFEISALRKEEAIRRASRIPS
jgi:hypothetical protein